MRTSVWHIIILILLSAMVCSCSHKSIECPGSSMRRVTVLFDWSHTENASPDGMAIYFYPVSPEGKIWRYDISGREGGPIEIPTGQYRMVSYNNDLPGITISGAESFGSLTANAIDNNKEKTLTTTGMLFGCSIEDIRVTRCGVEYLTPDGHTKDCGQGIIRCLPDSLSTMFFIDILDFTGMERIRTIRAILKGVAPSIVIEDAKPVGEQSALFLPLEFTGRRNTLVGSACAFSFNNPASLSLTLIATLKDGTTYTRNLEPSEFTVASASAHNVHLIIDSVNLPENPGSGDVGGIDVGVDGWTVIEIDIGTEIP